MIDRKLARAQLIVGSCWLAMVVVEGGLEECPIITEWLKLEDVVSRATKGKLALCRTDSINRSTVADNHELLIPLLKNLGTLVQTKTLHSCATS